MPIPQQVDLAALTPTDIKTLNLSTDPFIKSAPLAALPKAGFTLAKIILSIIGVYLVFLMIYIGFAKADSVENMDLSSRTILADSTAFAHQQAMIQAYTLEKKSSHDFIIQISQMVLLNLLLPTLTAVLGYIFGSREDTRKPGS